MIVHILAAVDLVTVIPSMFNDLRVVLAIITVMAGVAFAAMGLRRGIATAVGRLIGAVVLAALLIVSPWLLDAVKQHTDGGLTHSGGLTVGQYGR